jgi:CBS domain-containing protein
MSLCVQDAMITDVASIALNESIDNAAKLMSQRGISSLMVMSNDVLHGIITERDILSRVVAKGLSPSEVRVVDVMSPSLITIGPETPLEDANRIMVERRIKKLPVVEPTTRRLIGILSLTDFARVQHKLIEAAKRIIPGNDGDDMGFVAGALKSDEGQHLEFKSTLRYDLVKRCVNPELEQVIMKTISAFMNADGGDLIIGVSDTRQVIGLSLDYQTLRIPTRDGFENKLICLVSTKVGDSFLRFIRLSFPMISGHEICRVQVLPSSEPVFIKDGSQEQFYVRTGNNSRPFGLSDTTKYVIERWR